MMREGRNQQPLLYLTTLNAQVDLDMNAVILEGFSETSVLVRSASNDRRRPGFSLSDSHEFTISDDNKEMGHYGYVWAQTKHKNRLALPSWNEILDGLLELLC